MSVDYESGRLAPDSVRGMFDRIAPVYDAMNRVMTLGLDQRWRRLAVRLVVRPGDRVLDGCCGTGDLGIAAAAAGANVVGLDFSPRMLERARRKAPELEWIQGDLLELPFAVAHSSYESDGLLSPTVALASQRADLALTLGERILGRREPRPLLFQL